MRVCLKSFRLPSPQTQDCDLDAPPTPGGRTRASAACPPLPPARETAVRFVFMEPSLDGMLMALHSCFQGRQGPAI